MTKTIAVASIMLFTLGACSTVSEKMDKMTKPAGISAVDCFSAGGTIDNASGASMCKMKDGSQKPVL